MPTGEQQRNVRRFAGEFRVIFNEVLALQKERRGRGEKKLGYFGPWLPSTSLRSGG